MTISFEVNKNKTGIVVKGLEYITNQYIVEGSIPMNGYRYSDTISLNVIEKLDSNEEVDYMLQDIDTHYIESTYTDVLDETSFTLTDDGLYKVTHIIIPTKSWLISYIATYSTTPSSTIYVYDSGKYYKYNLGVYTEVLLEEILEINQVGTTISKESKYTFIMDLIERCYYLLCDYLIDLLCGACKANDNLEYYYWKLLFTLRHAIRYDLDLGKYTEALKLLEDSTGCNKLCSTIKNKTNIGGLDCGCSV